MYRRFRHLRVPGTRSAFCDVPNGLLIEAVAKVDCVHCLQLLAVSLFLGGEPLTEDQKK